MNFFSIFRQNLRGEDLPWCGRPAIFEHIQANLDRAGKLTGAGIKLPDEERRCHGEKIRWVAGAMDGVFGHHMAAGGGASLAKKIAGLVESISRKNSRHHKVELYNLLLKDQLIQAVDPASEKIAAAGISSQPYLHDFAKWLAFQSPDRGPVKFGIVLLGLIRDRNDLDPIRTLGKHEEFTLYSAVALSNMSDNPEQELWELAKSVDGWGRIHLVERLRGTQNPEIKKWLLREGYKNSIMVEYLAYTCAVAGDLKSELSKPEIDADLLTGAGEMIEALINGGPAEDMDCYGDGAEAVRLYVDHLKTRSGLNLGDFLILHRVKSFVENEAAGREERKRKGWTDELRSSLLDDLHQILIDSKWTRLILEKQHSACDLEFWQVDQAASILRIDLWDTHWKRLLENPTDPHCWYNVMKKANSGRIDQIVALAAAKIPLDDIATGPADSLGLGPEYNLHSCLDFILQELDKYPGKGIELIGAGLGSPVTRNRNMAVKALSAWGRDNCPEEIGIMLEQAEREEPNEDTRRAIRNLPGGKK